MRRLARPLILGCIVAGAAFSYAVATTDARIGAATGTLVPALRFLSPAELGPVLATSDKTTKQLLAAGGLRPYEFFMDVPSADWTLTRDGRLSGKPEASVALEIFVRDCLGSIVGRAFTLTVVKPEDYTTIQILTGALPSAVMGSPYTAQLEAAGGIMGYTYSLVDTDKANFPAGLILTTEGLIIGKPSAVPAASLPFTVRVTDGAGRSATKQFTIDVVAGQIGGDLIVQQGWFRLDFSRVNNDRLDLVLFVNDRNLTEAAFKNTDSPARFQLQFGRFRSGEMTLSSKGIYKTANRDGFIRVNPKTGRIRFKLTNFDLISSLQAERVGFDDPIVPIIAGLSWVGQETGSDGTPRTVNFGAGGIETAHFRYKRSAGTGVGRYKIQDEDTPGGVFFLTKCHGRISTNKLGRDEMRLSVSGYVRGVNGASAAPTPADDVTVGVGAYNQTLAGSSFRYSGSDTAPKASYRAPGAIGVRQLVIGGGGRQFSVVTGQVLTSPPVGVVPEPPNYGFNGQIQPGVELSVPVYLLVRPFAGGGIVFDGAASISVFRKGNSVGPMK